MRDERECQIEVRLQAAINDSFVTLANDYPVALNGLRQYSCQCAFHKTGKPLGHRGQKGTLSSA
jgi:hypothetical protein